MGWFTHSLEHSNGRFPLKEYLGLCGLMITCGFAFSFTGIETHPSDELIQFFTRNIKKLPQSELKLVQRFPSLSHAHTAEQALIIISLSHAHRFEEASILVESMAKLQNIDGSWNLWYPIATPSEFNIQTDAIAWMVLAIDHFQEQFNDYRFSPSAERAIRYIQHLKQPTTPSQIHWYRHSTRQDFASTQDLSVIAMALEHFRLRSDGDFLYKSESFRIKNELHSLMTATPLWIAGFDLKQGKLIYDSTDWKTGAFAALVPPQQPSIEEISVYKNHFANQCIKKTEPLPGIAQRGIASIGPQETGPRQWSLWLAAEVRDLPCDGVRLNQKIKQWHQENPSLELIGNLEEIAWVYLAKNKVNPFFFKKKPL